MHLSYAPSTRIRGYFLNPYIFPCEFASHPHVSNLITCDCTVKLAMWNGGSTLRDFLLCLKGEPDTMIDNQNVLPDWKICVIMKAKYFTGRSARSAKEATLPLESTPNTAYSCLLTKFTEESQILQWIKRHGWPFVVKFNNVYLYGTIYIDSTSTQDIFMQRLYSFNFNTGYFCARQILIQLQRPKLCFIKRIYIFNFNKRKIFHLTKHIYSTLQVPGHR